MVGFHFPIGEQLAYHHRVDHIIFGKQYGFTLQVSGCFGNCFGRLGGCFKIKVEIKYRPLTRYAIEPDCTTVKVNQFFYNGQAKAGSTLIAGFDGLYLRETIKNGIPKVLRYPYACIFYFKPQLVYAVLACLFFYVNINLSNLGKFDGVGYQVTQYLRCLGFVKLIVIANAIVNIEV